MSTTKTECITCRLVARRDAGLAPLWDAMYRTEFFDVVHANNAYLPGWLVIVLRRHAESIAELSSDESGELGFLIHGVSEALHGIVGCEKTYVMQFAEAEGHGHVHFHVVPRMVDMAAENKGPNCFKYLGATEEDRVPEEEMNQIGEKIRRYFSG